MKGKGFQKQECSVRVRSALISPRCPQQVPLSCWVLGLLLLRLKEARVRYAPKIQFRKRYVSNHHLELQPQFSKVLNCA